MDETHLAALLENGLKQLSAQIEESRAEVRHLHVSVEDLRSKIQQVAEGVLTVDQKLDRHILDNDRQFDDVRAMMRLSYVQLEQRVSRIEQG